VIGDLRQSIAQQIEPAVQIRYHISQAQRLQM
jgi:hypothetical protein